MPNPIYSKQKKETIAMFREMRRKNQQMSDEEARDILAAATSGVLALAGENGYPYAVPMSFAYDEEKERLLFHTARVGHKMTAIERCDKASFCIIAEDSSAQELLGLRPRSIGQWLEDLAVS